MNALFALILTGLMLASSVSQFKPAAGPGGMGDIPESSMAEDITAEAVAEPAMEEPGIAPEEEAEAVMPSANPKFAVFLPERIERVWYWYQYTDESQHIVQSAVEKALLNAGLDVVDISSLSLPDQGELSQVMSPQQTVRWAADAGVDYIIVGTATADPHSQSVAYGQTVVRSAANISARIIRVSDSKIMGVQDATALTGGQAVAAAAREALKKAGDDIGRKLARSAKSLSES